jgi:hypothetical protein
MKSLLLLFLTMVISGFSVPNPEYHFVFPPFISGDSFRLYSDYVYDEHDVSLQPQTIRPNSTVFVQTNYLKDFFTKIHPSIPCRYILITHNSDDPAPGDFAKHLDDKKIIAWFGENYDGCQHPKFHQLPMGLANFNWPNGNGDIVKKVMSINPVKEHLAHMGFTIQTNYAERWEVFRLFSQAPFCFRTIKKTFEKYLLDVAASKFEIAPRGFAWDTYRLWECLYLGTIPIVRTSPLDSLYEGLPVLIIKDWKQVTPDFLNQSYAEMSKKLYNMEKTTLTYWTQLIDSYKQ